MFYTRFYKAVFHPETAEAHLAELLLNRTFVDYFNVFLTLPIFAQKLTYVFEDCAFELDPPIEREGEECSTQDIIVWLIQERLPYFVASSLYMEYCICQTLIYNEEWEDMHFKVLANMNPAVPYPVPFTMYCMGTIMGMRKFKAYLEKTEGERLLLFLMDAERLRRIPNSMIGAQWRVFREMQLKYFNRKKLLFDDETMQVFHDLLKDGYTFLKSLCYIRKLFQNPFEDIMDNHNDFIKWFVESCAEQTHMPSLATVEEAALLRLRTYWMQKFLLSCEIELVKKSAKTKLEKNLMTATEETGDVIDVVRTYMTLHSKQDSEQTVKRLRGGSLRYRNLFQAARPRAEVLVVLLTQISPGDFGKYLAPLQSVLQGSVASIKDFDAICKSQVAFSQMRFRFLDDPTLPDYDLCTTCNTANIKLTDAIQGVENIHLPALKILKLLQDRELAKKIRLEEGQADFSLDLDAACSMKSSKDVSYKHMQPPDTSMMSSKLKNALKRILDSLEKKDMEDAVKEEEAAEAKKIKTMRRKRTTLKVTMEQEKGSSSRMRSSMRRVDFKDGEEKQDGDESGPEDELEEEEEEEEEEGSDYSSSSSSDSDDGKSKRRKQSVKPDKTRRKRTWMKKRRRRAKKRTDSEDSWVLTSNKELWKQKRRKKKRSREEMEIQSKFQILRFSLSKSVHKKSIHHGDSFYNEVQEVLGLKNVAQLLKQKKRKQKRAQSIMADDDLDERFERAKRKSSNRQSVARKRNKPPPDGRQFSRKKNRAHAGSIFDRGYSRKRSTVFGRYGFDTRRQTTRFDIDDAGPLHTRRRSTRFGKGVRKRSRADSHGKRNRAYTSRFDDDFDELYKRRHTRAGSTFDDEDEEDNSTRRSSRALSRYGGGGGGGGRRRTTPASKYQEDLYKSRRKTSKYDFRRHSIFRDKIILPSMIKQMKKKPKLREVEGELLELPNEHKPLFTIGRRPTKLYTRIESISFEEKEESKIVCECEPEETLKTDETQGEDNKELEVVGDLRSKHLLHFENLRKEKQADIEHWFSFARKQENLTFITLANVDKLLPDKMFYYSHKDLKQCDPDDYPPEDLPGTPLVESLVQLINKRVPKPTCPQNAYTEVYPDTHDPRASKLVLENLTDLFEEITSEEEIGKSFKFNNKEYLLALAVERLAGSPYEDYLLQNGYYNFYCELSFLHEVRMYYGSKAWRHHDEAGDNLNAWILQLILMRHHLLTELDKNQFISLPKALVPYVAFALVKNYHEIVNMTLEIISENLLPFWYNYMQDDYSNFLDCCVKQKFVVTETTETFSQELEEIPKSTLRLYPSMSYDEPETKVEVALKDKEKSSQKPNATVKKKSSAQQKSVQKKTSSSRESGEKGQRNECPSPSTKSKGRKKQKGAKEEELDYNYNEDYLDFVDDEQDKKKESKKGKKKKDEMSSKKEKKKNKVQKEEKDKKKAQKEDNKKKAYSQESATSDADAQTASLRVTNRKYNFSPSAANESKIEKATRLLLEAGQQMNMFIPRDLERTKIVGSYEEGSLAEVKKPIVRSASVTAEKTKEYVATSDEFDREEELMNAVLERLKLKDAEEAESLEKRAFVWVAPSEKWIKATHSSKGLSTDDIPPEKLRPPAPLHFGDIFKNKILLEDFESFAEHMGVASQLKYLDTVNKLKVIPSTKTAARNELMSKIKLQYFYSLRKAKDTLKVEGPVVEYLAHGKSTEVDHFVLVQDLVIEHLTAHIFPKFLDTYAKIAKKKPAQESPSPGSFLDRGTKKVSVKKAHDKDLKLMDSILNMPLHVIKSFKALRLLSKIRNFSKLYLSMRKLVKKHKVFQQFLLYLRFEARVEADGKLNHEWGQPVMVDFNTRKIDLMKLPADTLFFLEADIFKTLVVGLRAETSRLVAEQLKMLDEKNLYHGHHHSHLVKAHLDKDSPEKEFISYKAKLMQYMYCNSLDFPPPVQINAKREYLMEISSAITTGKFTAGLFNKAALDLLPFITIMWNRYQSNKTDELFLTYLKDIKNHLADIAKTEIYVPVDVKRNQMQVGFCRYGEEFVKINWSVQSGARLLIPHNFTAASCVNFSLPNQIKVQQLLDQERKKKQHAFSFSLLSSAHRMSQASIRPFQGYAGKKLSMDVSSLLTSDQQLRRQSQHKNMQPITVPSESKTSSPFASHSQLATHRSNSFHFPSNHSTNNKLTGSSTKNQPLEYNNNSFNNLKLDYVHQMKTGRNMRKESSHKVLQSDTAAARLPKITVNNIVSLDKVESDVCTKDRHASASRTDTYRFSLESAMQKELSCVQPTMTCKSFQMIKHKLPPHLPRSKTAFCFPTADDSKYRKTHSQAGNRPPQMCTKNLKSKYQPNANLAPQTVLPDIFVVP